MSQKFLASKNIANECEEMFGVLVANEYSAADKDNWNQLSPFGTFPNQAGKQVFNAVDAENICNEFGSVAGKIAHPLGLPFYIGHPDHPAFKDDYKDKKAYGRIKELQNRHDPKCADCAAFANEASEEPCRQHGLFGRLKWNDDGKLLVANENFHGHSVNWQMHREGDGWHPHYLKSVGFTNEPGIPVPAITSANEKRTMSDKPKNFIDHVNSCLGTNFANEDDAMAGMTNYANEHKATKTALANLQGEHEKLAKTHGDLVTQMGALTKAFGANEAVETAVAPLFTAEAPRPASDLVPFLANELTTARAAVAATGELNAAKKVLTDAGLTVPEKDVLIFAANEAVGARTRATSLLKSFGDTIKKLAIAGGFMSKAELEAAAQDFANETKLTAFGDLKPKYRVTSGLGELPKHDQLLRKEATSKADNVNTFVQMVNERVEKNKRDKVKPTGGVSNYDFAYAQIANENVELLAKMKKPE